MYVDFYHMDSWKEVQTGGVGQLGHSHGHGTRQGWIESKSCSFMHLMAQKGLTKYTDFSERSPHPVAD